MAFFDATLFTVVPRALPGARRGARSADRARAAARPPTPAGPGRGRRASGRSCGWGSWIGGDRDGNPDVTAEITERTLRIQADHVLRGYEAVATRLMQTIAAATPAERVARPLASRLARDAEDLPETDRQLRRRFPDEPYRQRFGFIAERLRRTRAALAGEPAPLTGRYAIAGRPRRRAGRDRRTRSSPTASAASPGARSPSCAGSSRRSGSTSPRSRSASTRRSTRRRSRRSGRARPATTEVAPGVHARRGPRHVPGDRRGPGAVRVASLPSLRRQLHRRRPSDVDRRPRAGAARRGRRPATPTAPRAPILDVVPLFESSEALEDAGAILGALLDDPGLPRRPRRARRSPGGDARLLRLEQGIGLPGGGLDAPPGAGGPGRGGRERAASS